MGTDSKTVCQTVKKAKTKKINSQLHNVEHVEQSTFLNTRITFKYKLCNSNFVFSSK